MPSFDILEEAAYDGDEQNTNREGCYDGNRLQTIEGVFSKEQGYRQEDEHDADKSANLA